MGKVLDLDKFYIGIGENIKNYRFKLGYSQDDLAKFLDLTRTSIVNIEKGRQRPPIHTLVELSSFLKVSVDDLLPSKDERDQINFLKGIKENITELRKNFKEVPIEDDKMTHFFQISASK